MDEYEVEINGGEPISEPVENTETPSEVEPQKEVETQPVADQPNVTVKLPDGREVTPEKAVEEYKKLQAEFTRTSQELSKIKSNTNPPEKKPYDDPDWTPESYKEILDLAEQRVIEKLKYEQESKSREEQELTALVEQQLSEVKAIDPKVDEEKLLEHATKFGIPNLVNAYNNMQEFNKALETARSEAVKQATKRSSDPVATKPNQGIEVNEDDVYEGNYHYGSLVDALKAIKK